MYTLAWHIENEVILLTYQGTLEPNEPRQQIAGIVDFLEKSPHNVSLLVDLRGLETVKIDRKLLLASDAYKVLRHPNLSTIVLVGHVLPMLGFWLVIYGKITQMGYQRFDANEFDDAVSYLLEVNRIQR